MQAHDATLQVIDLGVMEYAEALRVQRQTHQRVLEGVSPRTMLLVEHPPVITVSGRKHAGQHVIASTAQLKQLGIDVQETDRGGDVTYHGPGQVVAYPIIPLPPYGLNVGRYMRLLEQVVIDTVAAFGVDAARSEGATGVWVGNEKIAALGIRVKRNVTMHGLALNVATDLTHFDTIVPCGIRDRGVTSLSKLLGEATPTMTQVKRTLTNTMQQHLSRLAEQRSVSAP